MTAKRFSDLFLKVLAYVCEIEERSFNGPSC